MTAQQNATFTMQQNIGVGALSFSRSSTALGFENIGFNPTAGGVAVKKYPVAWGVSPIPIIDLTVGTIAKATFNAYENIV